MAKAKKKSKKFNYRLAAICGLLLVIAVGIVGGALVLKMKGGAERNMREARQYQEAGQYALAADYYGRVVHKQPGNREALQGILDCYQYIVPDTAESAGNLYRSYLRVLRQAALHASPEEQEQRSSDLLEEQYKAAILSGSSGFWQSLSDTADEIIARTNDDSDLLARAYFLRAISELSLKDEQLTEDIDGLGNIRFPGESYLQKHLEMRPESDNGWAKMAFGQMAVARRLGLESRYAQEERNLALAKETFEKAKELNPQGVWTLLEVMRDAYVEQLWYIGKSIRDPGSVSDEQSEQLRELVRESLAEAEAAVLSEATDDPIAVIDIVRYLRLADGFDGESRAIKILEKALEHDPDSNRLKYELGLSQYAEGLLEDAAATAMGLIEAEPLGISLEAQTQWGYRILATKLAFDTQHMIFVRSTGEERQAALDQMEALREQIYELTGEMDDNPIVLQVDGKLASSDQRWTEAAALFERAIDKGAKDAMVLRLDASALEKSGQTGLAEQRFREALQSEPSDLRNHLSLAEFYARTRQPEKGLALLERLPMRVIESNELLNSTYQSLSLLASGTEVVPDGISDPILLDLANADRALNDEDFSTAMAVLRAGSEKKEDVRYYVAMAHVQSMSGDSEKAIGFIDDALGLQPENDRLKLLRIQYGDPVQGVIEYCNDRYSDELEREAMIYENLRSLARVRDGLAEDFDSEGDAEAAADARLIAEKAREAMKDYQAAADGAVNTVAGAFIGKFEEYLKEGKFEEARAMLPVAREKNFDKAEGNLAEARVELSLARKAAEEGRPNQELLQRGIAAADRGTKLAPWSDLAWRTLGWGREMQGDLAAAERAYSESYRLNPANLATLKKLASLLLGNEAEQVRAVAILREGAVQFPNDEYIRDLWLEAESRYGDPLVALTQRRQSFKENPDNRENAIRLAAMLARFNPSFELMVDDDGKRLMTSRQWLGLSDVRQAEILANLQAVWDKQMDDILAMIESDKDESFGQAILHAQVHVDRQQVESAITVLRDYLRNHSTDENRSGQTRAAAQFLIESGRTDEAVALLEEAIDSQSDEMEIDAALGSVLYASGIYGDAIPYLQSAVDAGEEDLYRHRLIESLLRTQQFDEGRAALAALKAESGNTYESYMLEAFLANRESILAGASGDASAESTGIDRYRTSLQAAMLEGPEMSRPYELLVESYLSDYLKTRDEALLT
ncbi:MAG: tetratricopeptide repeat protein, partial [Phycisphaerales bacterium]|nr:tetratricopeptide repeat protein [Phycisphaerales bacterium]